MELSLLCLLPCDRVSRDVYSSQMSFTDNALHCQASILACLSADALQRVAMAFFHAYGNWVFRFVCESSFRCLSTTAYSMPPVFVFYYLFFTTSQQNVCVSSNIETRCCDPLMEEMLLLFPYLAVFVHSICILISRKDEIDGSCLSHLLL